MKKAENRQLLHQQYNNDERLAIRIQTHELYTEPKIDLPQLVIDQIKWSGHETVVDVGCGNGSYIPHISARANRYVAVDLSHGMLSSIDHQQIEKVTADIHALPFKSHFADVVLANHMLYHIEDKPTAIKQIKKILKPGGILLAATNSGNNQPEIAELLKTTNLSQEEQANFRMPLIDFHLENGEAILQPHFKEVKKWEVKTHFVFNSAEPLLLYLATLGSPKDNYPEIATEIQKHVEAHIVQHGSYKVSKKAGVFICRQ